MAISRVCRMSGESVEGLRTMILSFRISELHSLLAFTGRNKSGNKTMLQVAACPIPVPSVT